MSKTKRKGLVRSAGATTSKVTTASGFEIDPKYLSLADTPGFQPVPFAKLWFYLTGPVESGKTTLAASWERAALIAPEAKYDAVAYWGEGTMPFHFMSQKDTEDFVDMLVADAEADRRQFDTVIFDTMEAWVFQVRNDLSEGFDAEAMLKTPTKDVVDFGKRGKGWDVVNQQALNPLRRLQVAGYGGVVLGHQRRQVIGEGADAKIIWASALNDGVLNPLHRMCHYAGNTKRTERKLADGSLEVTHTVSFTTFNSKLPVRQHVRLLNPVLEIGEGTGMATIKAAYEEAVEARRAELGLV